MTNQDILERAIQKARCNGFDTSVHALGMYDEKGEIIPQVLVFDHDFAKALWGVGEDYKLPGMNENIRLVGMPKYIWHLQQMVVADDPVRYLGENLGSN